MEHSEKFELVKSYYEKGLWDKTRVRNAVGRWITTEEWAEIVA